MSLKVQMLESHSMIYVRSYQQDHKDRLHKHLSDWAAAINDRNGRQDITPDSYIISAIPYDDLHHRYEDGTRTRESCSPVHILCLERDEESGYDCLDILFREQIGPTRLITTHLT